MQKYSLYAYDPGDHCLSIRKEKDNKYGEWVKWVEVKQLLNNLKEDYDNAINQQTKITPFFKSYQELKKALDE